MSMFYTNPANRIRLGGLASGLDTDSIVRDLMRIEQLKVDKLLQQRQLVEWRKEGYRSNIDLLRGFYNEHFDLLYAKENMASPNAYNTLKITPSDDKYLSITTGAGAAQRNMKITEIELAKAAYVKSPSMSEGEGTSVTKPLASEGLSGDINLEGHSLTITVDGDTKVITFDKTYESDKYEDLKNDFQKMIDEKFGEHRVEVGLTEGRIILSAQSSTVKVFEHPIVEDGDKFGFDLNQSNRIDANSTLLGLKNQFREPLKFDEDGNISFTINGEEFTFSENDTLRAVMAKINSSKAGVTISYSSMTDGFEIINTKTGAGAALTIDDTAGNFLEALGLKSDNVQKGSDARMVLDGKTLYRSSNNFTIDGVTYNLIHNLEETEEPITLTAVRDVDKAFENIKNFVESYNKVIETINKSLSEERYRDYPPLTDAQKADMKDKDIELWEERAISGILQRDPLLQKIAHDMRRALTDMVKGSSINLSSIGISTGDWTERGKLHIDEGKLKEALRENGDEIMHLFSNRSEISYSPNNTREQRITRYEESGLVQRLSDILQDNIRTTRDNDGRKGILLERAGMAGDASDKVNLIEKQLKDMNKRIDQALDRMQRAEARYWAQFTAMETALQQMSSQSMWLAQQFGGGMYY